MNAMVADSTNRVYGIYSLSTNDFLRLFVEHDETLQLRIGKDYPVPPYTYIVVIEYTKTTD